MFMAGFCIPRLQVWQNSNLDNIKHSEILLPITVGLRNLFETNLKRNFLDVTGLLYELL